MFTERTHTMLKVVPEAQDSQPSSSKSMWDGALIIIDYYAYMLPQFLFA